MYVYAVTILKELFIQYIILDLCTFIAWEKLSHFHG